MRRFATTVFGSLGALLLLVLSPSGSSAQAPADSVRAEAGVPAPVVFAGDTLFVLHERLGPFSAQERAAAIAARLARLASDPLRRIDSLSVLEGETSADIVADDVVLMAVTDAGAEAAGLSRSQVANGYARMLLGAIRERMHSASLKSILLGIVFTVIATAVLLIVLKLLNQGFPRIHAKIHSWHGRRIFTFRIQRLEVVSAEKILRFLNNAARAFRFVLTLVLLYSYLTLVFSFFPWTRGFASTLLHYTLSPLGAVGRGFVSYIPNLFFITVIAGVTHYLSRFIRSIFLEIERGTLSFPNFYREWAEPTQKIGRFFVIVFAAIVVFPYLPGAGSPAFQGVGVFLGLLFSLGSASAHRESGRGARADLHARVPSRRPGQDRRHGGGCRGEDAPRDARAHDQARGHHDPGPVPPALLRGPGVPDLPGRRRLGEERGADRRGGGVKAMDETLRRWLFDPTVGKLVAAFLSLAAISVIVRVLHRSAGRYVSDADIPYRARKFITFLSYLVGILLLAAIFSDRLRGLTVAFGVAGAGIAFALQEVIASVAGWFAISFAGFFKTGDRVQLGGIKGDVIDIGVLRTTVMECGEWVSGDLYNGRVVRIANSFVFKEPVFNCSGDFPFLIRYVVDYKKRRGVKTLLFERLLDEIGKSEGRVALASATFQIVDPPLLKVQVTKSDG